jgi:signal transduction histidine kinase
MRGIRLGTRLGTRRGTRRGTRLGTAGAPVVVVAAIVALAVLGTVPSPGPWTALAVAGLALAVGSGAGGPRRGAWVLAAMLAADVVRVATGVTGPWAALAELPSALVRAGLPWLAAVAWHLRSQVRRQAEARVQDQRRRRREALRRERDAERLALAGSLHDDLGHALSLVALNLGRLELDASLAPHARESVTAARRELTGAVERLGDSVGSLRTGTAPRLTATDGAAGSDGAVAGLLSRARRAGLDLRVTGLAATRSLPADRRHLLARVLQEALTNATKHAPGEPVRVCLTAAPGGTGVRVRNPLPGGRPSGPGAGSGLDALARLVQDAGGALRATEAAGEFVLEVDLSAPGPGVLVRPPDGPGRPSVGQGDAEHGDTDDRDTADAAAADEREDRRAHELTTRAGRRGRWILAGAAALAVVALGAVEAVGWAQAAAANPLDDGSGDVVRSVTTVVAGGR